MNTILLRNQGILPGGTVPALFDRKQSLLDLPGFPKVQEERRAGLSLPRDLLVVFEFRPVALPLWPGCQGGQLYPHGIFRA